MSDKRSNIEKAPIKPVRLYSDKELEKEMRTISEDDLVDVPEKPKRKFWKHTPLGRTLSLRNDSLKKAVKIVGSIGVSAVTAYTGIKIDIIPKQTIESMFLILQELSFLNDPVVIIILIALGLFGVFSGWLIHKEFISHEMGEEFKQLLKAAKDARDPDSPGGKKYTPEERAKILAETLDVAEETLDHFGIYIDLDGDGK